MNYDFLELHEFYYLQYIKEPNVFLYFIDVKDGKLHCTDCLDGAFFFSYKVALSFQGRIKDVFGLEFQIVKVV